MGRVQSCRLDEATYKFSGCINALLHDSPKLSIVTEILLSFLRGFAKAVCRELWFLGDLAVV